MIDQTTPDSSEPDSKRIVLQRLVRQVKCFVFGHSEGGVIITKQDGYYQWGTCSRCGESVERDGHIWTDDPWRKSHVPNNKAHRRLSQSTDEK